MSKPRPPVFAYTIEALGSVLRRASEAALSQRNADGIAALGDLVESFVGEADTMANDRQWIVEKPLVVSIALGMFGATKEGDDLYQKCFAAWGKDDKAGFEAAAAPVVEYMKADAHTVRAALIASRKVA